MNSQKKPHEKSGGFALEQAVKHESFHPTNFQDGFDVYLVRTLKVRNKSNHFAIRRPGSKVID
jgi:hypothetical protein